MSADLAKDHYQPGVERSVQRYVLGVVLAIAIAWTYNWPLAYVMPVFLAKFFADKPAPDRHTFTELLWAMTATVLVALLVSRGVTHYPLLMLLLIALVMFWAYYLFQNPAWSFFAVMLMIAVLLIPYVGLLDPTLPRLLGEGLALSGAGAVAIFWVLHRLIPDPRMISATAEPQNRVVASGLGVTNALKALAISFPVIAYCYCFQASGALLTMAFIGILSLQLTVAGSIKLSRFLLLTNVVGGLLAVLAYQLLVTVPWLPFMLALMTLFTTLFARKLYGQPDLAPLVAGTFSATLVLLGSVLATGDKGMELSFYARIGQIVLAGIYLIGAAGVIDCLTQD